jgi:hypothetical protein
MSTTKDQESDASQGAPLAVCINDCQLDYGQPYSELVRICFQVGCAFAEMRWGRSTEAAFNVATLAFVRNNRPALPRDSQAMADDELQQT